NVGSRERDEARSLMRGWFRRLRGAVVETLNRGVSGLRSLHGREGRWNGAGARTGLTLEVHCGPARVPLSDRSHTIAGPACYALIGGSSAWGDQHGSTRPDAKISSGIGKEAQGVRMRAGAEA